MAKRHRQQGVLVAAVSPIYEYHAFYMPRSASITCSGEGKAISDWRTVDRFHERPRRTDDDDDDDDA